MAGRPGNGLARLRKAAGHTQASFVRSFAQEAAQLRVDASVSVRQLRRWESETPPPLPHPSQQVVLEALFGMPLAEMGFDVPRHRVTVAVPISDPEEVKRRTFVADVGGLAAGALVPARPGPRIGTADLDRFRVRLDGFYATDHTAGSVPAMTQADASRRDHGRPGRASYTTAWVVGYKRCSPSCTVTGPGTATTEDASRRAAPPAWRPSPRLSSSTTRCFRSPCWRRSYSLRSRPDRSWEAASAVENAHRLATHAGAGHTVHLVLALREANVATHAGDLSGARRALSRAVSTRGARTPTPKCPTGPSSSGRSRSTTPRRTCTYVQSSPSALCRSSVRPCAAWAVGSLATAPRTG